MTTTTMPYIGSKISLITMSELRYEGILMNVNTVNSTVTLREVRMFGTENRAGSSYVMPSREVFDYIVFNGKDIKDLTVCEPSLPIKEDPAVVSVNVPPQQQNAGHHQQSNSPSTGRRPQDVRNDYGGHMGYGDSNMGRNNNMGGYGHPSNMMNDGYGRPGPNGSNNVYDMGGRRRSLMRNSDMQGRMGMGRGGNYGRGGGGYNGPQRNKARGIVGELHAQPNTSLTTQVAEAFNFEDANQKFDKNTLSEEAIKDPKLKVPQVAKYDRATSFFDNISCETLDKKEGRSARIDRTEQRKLDQETFGLSAAMSRGPRYYKKGFRRGPGMRPRREMGGYGMEKPYGARIPLI